MPILHLIAGPNGAGKTLLRDVLLTPYRPGLSAVDAQAYAATRLRHMHDAAARAQAARAWADAERRMRLAEGQSFVTETVFSHPSRLALIAQAQAMGFQVVLYVLALDDPGRLVARVAQRVREGGEHVPDGKVLIRYPRSMALLRQGAFLADLAFLFDACDVEEGGPCLVATLSRGAPPQLHLSEVPRWARQVLGL